MFEVSKMSREPRISAFSLLRGVEGGQELLRPKFNDSEWRVYNSLGSSNIFSSSAGRIFDGVASILGVCDVMSYEGQAAMYLEGLAMRYRQRKTDNLAPYSVEIDNSNILNIRLILSEILSDIQTGCSKEAIAYRFHLTMARSIISYAEKLALERIALSGGVFQNALLVDLCHQLAGDKVRLFTHWEFSPNDECIPFGQIALAYLDEHTVDVRSG